MEESNFIDYCEETDSCCSLPLRRQGQEQDFER